MKQRLLRRLWPLYAACFLQGFVLWYPIEKFFMMDIGFNDATIGVMVATYVVAVVLCETPSGILADRWSRRGVLALATVFLALSSVIAGVSHTESVFLLSMVCWGVFAALQSGTFDSILYDTLLEEKGNVKNYEKWLGNLKLLESSAFVGSALIGGVVAEMSDLRTTFWATIPITAISLFCLWKFREPTLHKADEMVRIDIHIRRTFAAILRQPKLLPTIIILILITCTTEMMLEFNQLWYIALVLPTVFYGLATGILYAGFGAGGAVVNYINLYRRSVMAVVLSLIALSLAIFIVSRNVWVIVAAQTIFVTALIAIEVVFTKKMHDNISSNIRAGASSAIGTLGSVMIIPTSLLFGWASFQVGIFEASWVLVALCAVLAVFVAREILAKRSIVK